jgi:hypothetical protein
MKQLETIGLVVLAALMTMAFAGTTSALAESTALCDEDPLPNAACPSGHLITHLHETGKAKVLSSTSFECDVLYLGDALSSLANPLVIHGSFTYTNCTNNCTLAEENGPSEKKYLKEGHELAKITYTFLLHSNCAGIQCRFVGSNVIGHSLGPLLSAEGTESSGTEQVLSKESGLFCSSTCKLDFELEELDTYITN